MPVSSPAGGDPLPPQLYASGCQIYCAKGDVSAEEEAAYILAAAGSGTDKPLRGIMHAGAVLDSKVIANISTASIRTEYSGGCWGRAGQAGLFPRGIGVIIMHLVGKHEWCSQRNALQTAGIRLLNAPAPPATPCNVQARCTARSSCFPAPPLPPCRCSSSSPP